MNDHSHDNIAIDSNEPSWLKQALTEGLSGEMDLKWEEEEEAAPPEFLEACSDAAKIAFTVGLLRGVRNRAGTKLDHLPLLDYLRELAILAGITDLRPILLSFDVQPEGEMNVLNAGALGRLARAIGMDLGEALDRAKIAMAGLAGMAREAWVPAAVMVGHECDPEHPGGALFHSKALEALWTRVLDSGRSDILTLYNFIESELRTAYNDN